VHPAPVTASEGVTLVGAQEVSQTACTSGRKEYKSILIIYFLRCQCFPDKRPFHDLKSLVVLWTKAQYLGKSVADKTNGLLCIFFLDTGCYLLVI